MSLTIFEALEQLDKKQTERIAQLKIELDIKQIELKTRFETKMKEKIAHMKVQIMVEVNQKRKAATTHTIQ
jgi:hypothetical protein